MTCKLERFIPYTVIHCYAQVGLPAKSGVSGIVLVIVPNVVGFATWSPPLDTIGNSARGVMFAEELVKIYNFHTFDSVTAKPYPSPFKPFPDWRAHKRQEEPESAKLRGTKSEACPTLVCCIPGKIVEMFWTEFNLLSRETRWRLRELIWLAST